jgi:hypothetical protein
MGPWSGWGFSDGWGGHCFPNGGGGRVPFFKNRQTKHQNIDISMLNAVHAEELLK